MSPWWSYLLTAVGVFGLFLAGRRDRRGWMVGIGAQALWATYAVSSRQWGFLVSAAAYGWVYSKNARAWGNDTSSRARGETGPCCAEPRWVEVDGVGRWVAPPCACEEAR